jgi:Zn ribbon nucleic-acid-binding protein
MVPPKVVISKSQRSDHIDVRGGRPYNRRMKPASALACPRCGGFMTLDGWERDGTLHCVNCGFVAWPRLPMMASPRRPVKLEVAR